MANTLRIKRRSGAGAAGAPASLQNAELAFNEADNTLYYGVGTGGAGGTATTVDPIGGRGAFLALTGTQTVAGDKTFSSPVSVATPTAASHAVTKAYLEGFNFLTANQSITISGDASGTGSTAISLTLAASGVTAGTYPKVTVDSKGRVTVGAALVATDIPALDAAKITTGTFSAGLIPTLNQSTTGNAATATTLQTARLIGGVSFNGSANINLPGVNAAGTQDTSGTAANATKLATGRTISATGDATGTSAAFDGTAAASIPLVLANSGVTAGTYTKITVDAKGRATVGATLAATDVATLTAAKISDFDTQVRTSRLDQMAAPTAPVVLNGQKITGLAEPTAASDAATKNYVDMSVQGLDPKGSVRAATTANIATLSGTMTIDGVSLIAGDRILVKDQTTTSQNGIYVVAAGAWSRSTDADSWAELISAYVFAESGTTNAEIGYLCTVDLGGTLGSTAVTFAQFTGAGTVVAGAGLTKTGNTIDVGAGTGIAVAADSIGLTGQALALHNLATAGMVARTAADTFAARSVAASGTGISVSNGDGVAGNPTVTLSAALYSVGALTPAADRLAYYTNGTTAALATFTAFGRSLIDDADATAGRTTLGLGTMATQNASAVVITGGTIDAITFDGGTF